MMRAIVVRQLGGPEGLKLEEVPPPQPRAGEVLVRVRAAGVNPVDTYIRAGAHARKAVPPYTPGFDGAGEIEAVGAGVTRFAAGDRVYIGGGTGSQPAGVGTYAELVVATPDQAHPLPAGISFAQGAALGIPYATAYRALFQRGGARPSETVLVHGATGGVGLAAVQMARAHGMTVIGSGGTDAGLEMVSAHGANVVVSHREQGYTDTIMKATAGVGVDLIIEMAAHVNLDRDLGLLARYGRVVIVGNRGRVEINPRDAMGRDADIRGLMLFNVAQDEMVEIHAALGAGLTNRTLNPVVGREMPLADAARAHEAIMEPGALGKIVLMLPGAAD
jgi:NADPH:quinone reductase